MKAINRYRCLSFVLLTAMAALPASAASTVALGAFTNPIVLDFESLPTGPIASNDPYFTSVGITSVTVVNGTPGDTLNSNTLGQSLGSVGGVLSVVGVGGPLDNGTVRGSPIFTINLAAPHDLFGLAYVDHDSSFPITFFLGAVQVDSFTYSNTGSENVYLQAASPFDRVVLGRDACCAGGYGIDNITLEATAVPEPSTLMLTFLGAVALIGSRMRRRR